MPWTDNDVRWVAARLMPAVYDINQGLLYDRNTRRLEALYQELTMSSKLQGIAGKFAKLHHDAEFEAGKLDARLDTEAARLPEVFSRAHGSVSGISTHVDDVANMLDQIDAVTKGVNGTMDETKSETAEVLPDSVGVPFDLATRRDRPR